MKTFLISLAIAVSMVLALPADAKSRFGGGKSSGMQRDSAKPAAAATPPSVAPAAAPAAGAATAATAASAAAKPAAAAAGNKWLGPLAGLAAGGLLASMFMGGGMGGFGGFKFFDFIIIIGFAVAAFYLFRMWRNRSNSNSNAPSNLQYAGAGNNVPAPAPMERTSSSPSSGGSFSTPEIGSRLQAVSSPAEANALAQAPRIPADFDVEPFARHARGAFIRMQAANDVGDKTDIRDFTTPEMYAEISMQIQERKGETQRTDVTKLDVTVLEVVTENSKAIASVRFTGELQFDGDTQVEKFDEVWHVVKRVDEANATWLVAGIQQLS
jgi:predicted lipid-binding transport protein (Tim44 family)